MSKLKDLIKNIEEMPINELIELLDKYDIKLIPKDKNTDDKWLENKLKEIKNTFEGLDSSIKNNKE